MLLRNADVGSKARKVFNRLVPNERDLPVFCVSNEEYCMLKYPDQGDCLYPEDTGIPELRSFVLGLAAPHVQKHFERRSKSANPSFLRTIELWCTKAPVDNAEEILAEIMIP